MYKWCHESRRNYTFVNLKATKISKRCVFVFGHVAQDGYQKNDRKRAVIWPLLVLELSTVNEESDNLVDGEQESGQQISISW